MHTARKTSSELSVLDWYQTLPNTKGYLYINVTEISLSLPIISTRKLNQTHSKKNVDEFAQIDNLFSNIKVKQ